MINVKDTIRNYLIELKSYYEVIIYNYNKELSNLDNNNINSIKKQLDLYTYKLNKLDKFINNLSNDNVTKIIIDLEG